MKTTQLSDVVIINNLEKHKIICFVSIIPPECASRFCYQTANLSTLTCKKVHESGKQKQTLDRGDSGHVQQTPDDTNFCSNTTFFHHKEIC